MPKDDINYRFTENGIVYDFYDVFVPAENFRQPALWVFGQAQTGGLGTNDTTPERFTPVTTFAGGTTWKQVAASKEHTVAIKTDGTLWGWGQNGSFTEKLGIGGGASRSTPVTTFAGGNNWKQVSTSLRSRNVAAIKTDGTLWVWGNNENGQLGSPSGQGLTPITTFAGENNWKQVSCGEDYTAAIKTDGSLWVWGNNNDAKLGINIGGGTRNTPVTTFAGGNNWKQVSCGEANMAAVKTDGSLWTWGVGTSGQLGNFANTTRSTPVTTFAGGNTWKQVSVGTGAIMAIKTDGTLWGWGTSSSGALGINGYETTSTPVTTFAGGNNWKQVSCGWTYTMATKTDGTLWGWGRGANGQLGNNFSNNIVQPVTTFAGGNNWKQVAAGYRNSAAIKYQPDP